MTVTHGAPRHDQETACNSTAVVHDRGDNSISFAQGFTHDLGPRCRNCGTTEAHCAHVEGCCDDGGCTHFGPRLLAVRARRQGDTCEECHRPVSERGRAGCPGLCADRQRDYWRDRQRRHSDTPQNAENFLGLRRPSLRVVS